MSEEVQEAIKQLKKTTKSLEKTNIIKVKLLKCGTKNIAKETGEHTNEIKQGVIISVFFVFLFCFVFCFFLKTHNTHTLDEGILRWTPHNQNNAHYRTNTTMYNWKDFFKSDTGVPQVDG